MTGERERASYLPNREEVLVGRVTDGEATPADWAELEALARQDGTVWQRLAESQRAHARFEQAVEDEIAICELVEAPDRRALAHGAFVTRIREYSGWLVAAALGLAWLGVYGLPGGAPGVSAPRPSGLQTAGLGGVGRPQYVSMPSDEALEQYKRAGLASGRFVAELPMQFVESRPTADGSAQEVIFIRPMLERVMAQDVSVLKFQTDEHGQPVRAEPWKLPRTGSNPL